VKHAGLFVSDSDYRVDRQQRREISDGSCQRPKHSKLGTIVAIVGIERVADEAAIARAASEQPDLALELDGGRGKQRDIERHAGIADGKPGSEIVAAVDDQIMGS
jgi:hypothetical protein